MWRLRSLTGILVIMAAGLCMAEEAGKTDSEKRPISRQVTIGVVESPLPPPSIPARFARSSVYPPMPGHRSYSGQPAVSPAQSHSLWQGER